MELMFKKSTEKVPFCFIFFKIFTYPGCIYIYFKEVLLSFFLLKIVVSVLGTYVPKNTGEVPLYFLFKILQVLMELMS